jgi:AraC family L-rhamnose operon transcriptional activator RhaR
MQLVPHSPGYTLNADAFMAPNELVGFSVGMHLATVFDHFHDFYELALVLEGHGQHVTSGTSRSVGRGSVIFVPPGVSHAWELCDDLVVYNCFVRVEAARFDISWTKRDPRLSFLFAPAGSGAALPVELDLDEVALEECHSHLEAIRLRPADDRSEAFDLGHLLLALDGLARQLGPECVGQGVAGPGAPGLVRSAVRLLEVDLRRHWTLDALSDELCVGVFHLVRLFKQWMGMPPIAYANQRRSERAAVLLASTDDPIATIGAEVGWPDPSHFARRFRAIYGSSPRAFRAASRAHAVHEPTVGSAHAGSARGQRLAR